MTRKIEAVSGEAVKVRKNLAPDAKLKAQLKARKEAAVDAAQMKAATKANIDAIKAINARERESPNAPQSAKLTSQKTANPSSGRIRNLRATTGIDKASIDAAANTKKTQAQLAREKLASAAAKNAQSQSHMHLEMETPTAETLRAKTESQTPKPGNQLIQLEPPRKTRPGPGPRSKSEARKPPIINATALLAAKYPNYFADNNDHRTKAESRAVFVFSSLILGLIAFGWMNWNQINFQAEGDFTYNSGLIGGITMLFILLYALRKRAKLLRKAGNMEVWYYFHLLGGVLGPLTIIFHTGFTIKSINSGVALFTMIIIVLSGLFGRYIYTRIGYSLHRKLLAIRDSETQLMEVLHSYDSPVSEQIERRLSHFALSVLTSQRSILKLPMRLVAIRGAAAACYVKVSNDLIAMVKAHASREGLSASDVRSRINREKEQLREHVSAVANIAHAHLFERILVKWRILHIPLLYILVITGLFHVLAVHMY